MNSFAANIIRSKGYYGHINDVRPYIRKIPSLNEITITKVPNTLITCTHCQGGKYQLHEHVNGLLEYVPCPICNKQGVISNSVN